MKENFVRVSDKDFVINDKKIILRGFGIGSWMNIEHFMIGIPGTESMLRNIFTDVYGKEKSDEFFDIFLSAFLTEEDFVLLKSLNINTLRLSFNYHHFLDDQKPGVIKESGFIHLDRVLDLCKKYGIYAVLDLHAVPGGQNPDWHADNDLGVSLFWNYRCFQEQVVALWSSIAGHYAHNPYVAGYDIVNEPCLVPDKDVFNLFIKKTIQAIRKNDENHIIFLEGDDWAKDFRLFNRIDDPQVAYSFHLYPANILNKKNPDKWPDDALRAAVEPFLLLREEKSRPVWCGETGNILTKKHIPSQTRVLKQMLDLYEENDISWSVWSYKDAGSLSLLYPSDHTSWSGFVKKFRKKWDLNKEIKTAYKTLGNIGRRHTKKIDTFLSYKLQFRLRGILHHLYCEQYVKPVLKTIPWHIIKDYPLSFLYKNCSKWEEIAELIQIYTKDG